MNLEKSESSGKHEVHKNSWHIRIISRVPAHPRDEPTRFEDEFMDVY